METKNIEHFIKKHNMIREHDKIIIGVSGGSDSICLLFVLNKLSEKINLSLKAVHINHELRETAKRDEDFVKDVCQELNIPCLIYKENVKDFAKNNKMSIEEAGREIRRMRFEEVLLNEKGDKIALGHHLDDSVETLLMNLARGTGLKGLTGIKPVWGNYIRPLLCMTKKEVKDLLKSNNINFQKDETNENIDFTRNRVREVTIPSLVDINSRAVNNISNTIAHLAEVDEFMSECTKEAFDKCVDIKTSDTNTSSLDTSKPDVLGNHTLMGSELKGSIIWGLVKEEEFSKYPKLIQKLVIKKILGDVAAQEKNIGAIHVDSVIDLIKKQVSRKVDLPHGLIARREYEGVKIFKTDENDKTKALAKSDREKATKENIVANETVANKTVENKIIENETIETREEETQSKEKYKLNIPGITLIPEMKLKVDCTIIDTEASTSPLELAMDRGFSGKSCHYKEDSLDGQPYFVYTKSMDYDIIKGGLSVRTREPGDFIVIDKKGHRQKLKSYFINEKIPSYKRDEIPLVADDSEIVWILGHRMSCGYEITEKTKNILEMRIVEDF